MKDTLEFLTELKYNNNREWFMSNKSRYKHIEDRVKNLAQELITEISLFDPEIASLTVKDCTYRIYRDVRFSKDKQPYKTHIGIYLCPGGKKSGFAGYYFHIEPPTQDYPQGSMLTSGLYMPHPMDLKSVREEISDNPENFIGSIEQAKGFSLSYENSLKRLPKGYTEGNIYDEYLKLKDIYVSRNLTNDFLTKPSLAPRIADQFKKTYDLIKILNRAIRFAREEYPDAYKSGRC